MKRGKKAELPEKNYNNNPIYPKTRDTDKSSEQNTLCLYKSKKETAWKLISSQSEPFFTPPLFRPTYDIDVYKKKHFFSLSPKSGHNV